MERKLKVMSAERERLIETITTGGILSVVAALINAVLSKNKNLMEKVRVFFGGTGLGTMVYYLMRNVDISDFWREMACICFASFASTVWPIVEKKFVSWFKKDRNVLPDNND